MGCKVFSTLFNHIMGAASCNIDPSQSNTHSHKQYYNPITNTSTTILESRKPQIIARAASEAVNIRIIYIAIRGLYSVILVYIWAMTMTIYGERISRRILWRAYPRLFYGVFNSLYFMALTAGQMRGEIITKKYILSK